MKAFLAAALRLIPVLIRDLVGLTGAASVAYGFYQIYAPLGFIAGGALAITGSYMASRAE